MARYSSDISRLLTEEEVMAMFKKAHGLTEAALISLLWVTAARPGELKVLKKEDVTLDDVRGILTIKLKTLKLGRVKEFMLKERSLEFERSLGLDANLYLETIISFNRLVNPERQVLEYSTRWMEKVTNRLGMEAIGRPIAPYHFRHSRISRLSAQGKGIAELMAFKGSADARSVSAYLHAKPFTVRL